VLEDDAADEDELDEDELVVEAPLLDELPVEELVDVVLDVLDVVVLLVVVALVVPLEDVVLAPPVPAGGKNASVTGVVPSVGDTSTPTIATLAPVALNSVPSTYGVPRSCTRS
jgi:hypothetical protein